MPDFVLNFENCPVHDATAEWHGECWGVRSDRDVIMCEPVQVSKGGCKVFVFEFCAFLLKNQKREPHLSEYDTVYCYFDIGQKTPR